MAVRIEFTAPESLVESLDEVRGHEPRASFIKRVLEREVDRADSNRRALEEGSRPPSRGEVWASAPMPGSAALEAGRCPDCGKANGVHKGDCPNHPGRKR